MLDDITFGWWWTGTNSQSSTSKALTWIQCKLGKQYLVKKFTLPWESNPGPTPIRGDTATLIASVGLKKICACVGTHWTFILMSLASSYC